MATSSTSRQSAEDVSQPLLEQLAQLTAAVQRLAQGSGGAVGPVDDPIARARARVVLGYQGLGALMGRVPQEGDVAVDTFEASRRRPDLLLLHGLPRRADWLEARSGVTLEVLPIRRCPWWEDEPDGGVVELRDQYDYDADAGPTGPEDQMRHTGSGFVRLRTIRQDQAVGSLLALDRRQGDLLAFGPRLGAFPPARAIPGPQGRAPQPPATVDESE